MSEKLNPAIERYASLLIQKIKEVEGSNWQQPWITTIMGSPRNIDGREYSQFNKLLLLFITDEYKYKTPVFLTFRQAEKESLHILKGSKSFPVTYYDFTVKHRLTGDKITIDEHRLLPEKMQNEFIVHPFLKYFNVFNLDQTNFSDKYPERWYRLLSEFTEEKTITTDGYSLPALDSLVDKQEWVCPIHLKSQDQAYYSHSIDKIVLPEQKQFPEGISFYNTLLHEMAHSTGHESRLNRPRHKHEGDSIYAREELIAELTAALSGKELGIHTQPQKGNAQYISSWLSALQENPQFIMTLLQDVSKASHMIIQNTNELNKEQKVNTEPIPSTEILKESSIINNTDNPHNIEFYKSPFLIDKSFLTNNTIEIDIPIKKEEIINFFSPELKEIIISDIPFYEDGCIAYLYCQFIDGKLELADEYEFQDAAGDLDQPIIKLSQIKAMNDIDNRISDINIFSLKEGGMAIRCKIDNIQYSSVKLGKEDVLTFSETTDRKLLASKYYKDELNGYPSKRAELSATSTKKLSAHVVLDNDKNVIEVNSPMITDRLTGSSSQLDTKGIDLKSLSGSQMKDLLSGKQVKAVAGIAGYLGLNKTPAGWALSIGKKIASIADSEAGI